MYDFGVKAISISGGECLLKDCLKEILLFINQESEKRKKLKEIVLISNGLLMNKDYLHLFKQCHVHLSMSLPGIETFEEHTGVDNANGVLHWFQEAKKLGLNTTVNITVTKKNYFELFKTVSMGLINGASSVLINRFLPGGRGLLYQNELALNRKQLNGMLDTTEEVLTLSNRYGHAGTEIPLCAIDSPKKYKHLGFGTKCAAAKDFFVIDPAGQVRTCNHSPKVVGNVFDDDIIIDKEYWSVFANRNYHPTICQPCKSIDVCDCGCREVAEILHHSPCAVDDSIELKLK
jgi:radical SAM protein with 4Fe4S-binding SPASM domain